MHNGFAMIASNGQMVLEPIHNIAHFGKLLKVFKLPKQIHSLLHHLVIVLRLGHVVDAKRGVGIAIELVFVHFDGRVIA